MAKKHGPAQAADRLFELAQHCKYSAADGSNELMAALDFAHQLLEQQGGSSQTMAEVAACRRLVEKIHADVHSAQATVRALTLKEIGLLR